MKSENKKPVVAASPTSPASDAQQGTETRRVLSPGQWIRAVHGVTAPFGYDRMPTVFG